MPAVVSDIESSLGFMRLLIKLTVALFVIMLICSFMIFFKEDDPRYRQIKSDLDLQQVQMTGNRQMYD